jgi:hypothetical protein
MILVSFSCAELVNLSLLGSQKEEKTTPTTDLTDDERLALELQMKVK